MPLKRGKPVRKALKAKAISRNGQEAGHTEPQSPQRKSLNPDFKIK
jgi:hypothetical protein